MTLSAEAVPSVTRRLDGHVATVEFDRPPNNFFDLALICALADAFEALDHVPQCRAIVLASTGRIFCAGADMVNRVDVEHDIESPKPPPRPLYKEAARLVRTAKPIVVAVQGPAIGGGLGLALVGDFRVTCPEARFSANFARLGFHPGFGLSFTLPRLVGHQQAALLMYTGRRIDGLQAMELGLADLLTDQASVRTAAQALAAEIAESAPLAVQSARESLRRGFADGVEQATEREMTEQRWHLQTRDYVEGVKAYQERRTPAFLGR